jgi:hypothetical protein
MYDIELSEWRLGFKSAHAMHTTVLAPPAERLALPPEQNAEKTPYSNQRGVGHDWRDEPVVSR